MSSILKALKKLENDKMYCKPDQLRIDAKILQDGLSKKISHSAIVLIATALFICGGGSTYYFMKREKTDLIIPLPTSSLPESRKQLSITTVIPETLNYRNVQSGTQAATTVKLPPLLKAQTLSLTPSAIIQNPPPSENQFEVVPNPDSKPLALATVPAISVTRPNLTVTGIAFQDGGSDNLAVINGVTVLSGTLIEGVRVEEIQKDRVRFSQGNEKFEIILNKSNR